MNRCYMCSPVNTVFHPHAPQFHAMVLSCRSGFLEGLMGLNRSQHLAQLTQQLYQCLCDHTLMQVSECRGGGGGVQAEIDLNVNSHPPAFVPAAQRIDAGSGPDHPGAGDLLSRLVGSDHRAAQEGSGERLSSVH